jgi:hypothetical protein
MLLMMKTLPPPANSINSQPQGMLTQEIIGSIGDRQKGPPTKISLEVSPLPRGITSHLKTAIGTWDESDRGSLFLLKETFVSPSESGRFNPLIRLSSCPANVIFFQRFIDLSPLGKYSY